MFRRFFAIFAIGGLALASVGLVGCQRHRNPIAFVNKGVEKISSGYDLNEVQKGKLVSLADSIKATLIEVRKSREQAVVTLNQELSQEGWNAPEVTAKLQGVLDVISKSLPEIVEKFGDFKSSLNPEQRNEMLKKFNRFQSSDK